MFFTFRQNNARGFIVGPPAVIIEARTFKAAVRQLRKAVNVDAFPCLDCCGARWPTWRDDEPFATLDEARDDLYNDEQRNGVVIITFKDRS